VVTSIPVKLPQWRAAAKEILERTGLPEAHVASELKAARSVVHRYFDGTRTPDADTIARVNAAIGKLLSDERIKEYLDSVTFVECLVPTANYLESVREVVRDCVKLMCRYLVDDYERPILEAIEALPRKKGLELSLELNRWRRRELIRHIDGTVPKRIATSDLLGIFLTHGLDFLSLTRPAHEMKRIAAEENLFLTISTVLAEITDNFPIRRQLETRIRTAFSTFREADLLAYELHLRAVQNSSEELGRSTARAEIFAALAAGKIPI